jgi:hypothetical protein
MKRENGIAPAVATSTGRTVLWRRKRKTGGRMNVGMRRAINIGRSERTGGPRRGTPGGGLC